MNKFKYYIKRKWRHFKYWLVRKLFPNDELNFLVIPGQLECNLRQITNTKTYSKTDWAFIGEDLIKARLVSEMYENLVNKLEYEETDENGYVTCSGTLTLAVR